MRIGAKVIHWGKSLSRHVAHAGRSATAGAACETGAASSTVQPDTPPTPKRSKRKYLARLLPNRTRHAATELQFVDLAKRSQTPGTGQNYKLSEQQQRKTLAASAPVSDRLNNKNVQKLERRFDKLCQENAHLLIRGVASPLPKNKSQAPPVAQQCYATMDEQVCRAAIGQQFCGPYRTALADQLLGLGTTDSGAAPFVHVGRISTALHAVCGGDTHLALQVLRAWEPVDPSTASARIALPSQKLSALRTRLKWSLAETNTGMDAIMHVERKTDWSNSRHKGYRDALNICAWLAHQPDRQGFDGAGAIAHFVAEARDNPRLNHAIGRNADHPTQLAHKALLYAVEKMLGNAERDVMQPELEACAGWQNMQDRHFKRILSRLAKSDLAPVHSHLGAYVAWREGFRTSVQGSDFERMVLPLQKLHTYWQRAAENSQPTAQDLAKNCAKVGIPNLRNAKKSPFKVLSIHGTLGADAGLLHQTGAQFRNHLRSVIAPLRAALYQQRRELGPQTLTIERQQTLTRIHVQICLLDLVHAQGAKGFKPDIDEVRSKVRQMQPGLATDEKILLSQLRQCGAWYNPRKIRLQYLEDLAGALLKPTALLKHAPTKEIEEQHAALHAQAADERSAQQEADLTYTRAMLDLRRARYITSGGRLHRADTASVVRPHDLWRGIRRQSPRVIDNPQALEKYLRSMETADNSVQVDIQTRSGVNFPDGPLVSLLAGSPLLVAPDLALSWLRGLSMTIGDSKAAYVFSISTAPKQFRGALGLVVAARLRMPWVNIGSGLTLGGDTEKTFKPGQRVTITIPKRAGYLQNTARLTQFLLDIVGRTEQPSCTQIWDSYVQTFGDTEEVSIGCSLEQRKSIGGKAPLTASAVLGPSAYKAGPSAQVGISGNKSTKTTQPVSGKMVSRSVHQRFEFLFNRGFGIGTQGPLQQDLPGGHQMQTRTVPLIGRMWSSAIAGGEVSVHLLEQDGKLCPKNCLRETFFSTPTAFAKYINSQRTAWEKVAEFPAFDGEELQGKAALDQMLKEAQMLCAGQCRFYERLTLDPAVASKIDLLSDMALDLAPAARRVMQANICHLIQDKRSWLAGNLYAAQTRVASSAIGSPIVVELLAQRSVQTSVKLLKLTAQAAPY
jgi:hypothetical protein